MYETKIDLRNWSNSNSSGNNNNNNGKEDEDGNEVEDGIGVNYGLLGDNLPPPAQVINFLKSKSIQNIKIFDPNTDVLKALEDSGLSVILRTRNEDLQALATDPTFATNWILTNVIPHASTINFTYISAGNVSYIRTISNFCIRSLAQFGLALKPKNLDIPVSTTISLQVLGTSYAPSNGVFFEDVIQFMQPIAQFLAARQYPLLANVYPYFAYSGNPSQIQLDYALFRKKVGQPTVEVVVTETGWPSAGDVYETIDNAQTYANNLIEHVSSSRATPTRPGKVLETYIFFSLQ
ncbi:hypothetical protein CQW23_07628 [Capsicum baccatum]|uniref:Uncharacterized protein n=1 Tax=Capsicum baccatum TaxID=33114 RepID=A0A2G2X6P7_CAPBA|nr:hypothetical protein CQW23_07628 [Capsicum baccatum]